MLDLLRVEAMKAAELIRKAESVHVFTHYDADGISSGAVLATAVNRLGKQFHDTFFKGLNSVPESEADLIILSDMGSGCPDIVERIEKDVVIVDHHAPVGRIEKRKQGCRSRKSTPLRTGRNLRAVCERSGVRCR